MGEFLNPTAQLFGLSDRDSPVRDLAPMCADAMSVICLAQFSLASTVQVR